LYKAGKTDIDSAADAAQALTPLVGRFSTSLFGLGLIGSGMLAVPILTGSSAYAAAEAFGWRASLDTNPTRASRFYILIAISTLVGMLINFTKIMGERVNGLGVNVLGWTATVVMSLAAIALVMTWGG